MPPSPRVSVQLDPEKFNDLCASMKIEPPTVRFRDHLPPGVRLTYSGGPGAVCYGTCSPDGEVVTVFTEIKQYEFDRIRAVNAELVITFLHELRHSWQHKSDAWQHGNVIADERDAEQFAQENYHKWRGVIRVHRKVFRKKLPG